MPLLANFSEIVFSAPLPPNKFMLLRQKHCDNPYFQIWQVFRFVSPVSKLKKASQRVFLKVWKPVSLLPIHELIGIRKISDAKMPVAFLNYIKSSGGSS